jgi:hypothetical protein
LYYFLCRIIFLNRQKKVQRVADAMMTWFYRGLRRERL